jgi:hypothetical protein
MNRRGFLKTAGVGSAALAIPTVVASAASPTVGFRVVSNSHTATVWRPTLVCLERRRTDQWFPSSR